MEKKAILLIRVSTIQQSLDEQSKELHRMAVADGYVDDEEHIIHIAYKESAIKLSEEERLGLQEMKRIIMSDSHVDCVYVWEVSRIARTKKVLFSIWDFLRTRNIQLIVKTPSLRLFDDDGTLNEGMETAFTLFGQMAESEMRNKKARFARGKKENAAKNKYNGGNIPFGYYLKEDKTFGVDEEQAEIIRTIFNLYEQGYSTTKLVKELRSLYADIKVTLSFVNNILKNELLTGRTIHVKKNEEGEIVDEEIKTTIKGVEQTWKLYSRSYPAIISERQYDRCREIATGNNTNASKAKYIYYAEKLLRCPICGGYMSGVANRSYYRCYDAWNPNRELNGQSEETRCPNKSTISINVIDSVLWHEAIAAEAMRYAQDKKHQEDKYQEEIALLRKKLAVCEERLSIVAGKEKRNYDLFVERGKKEWYLEKQAELNNERAEIKREQIQYEDKINQLIEVSRTLPTDKTIEQILQSGIDVGDLLKPQRGRRYSPAINAKWVELREAISAITSDEERQNIIRRHFSSVHFKDVETMYQYKRAARLVRARLIEITFAESGEKDYYFVIPNSGNGSLIFPSTPKGGMRYPQNPDFTIPVMHRYENKNQRKRREAARLIRLEEQERKRKGMLTIKDLMAKAGRSYGAIKYAILHKGLKATKEGKEYLIKEEDWEAYCSRKK